MRRKIGMDQDEAFREKRIHPRKKVKITALLKLGILISGRGYVKDISARGMCLLCPQVFKPMKTAQGKDFIGSALKVMFPSHALTVGGIIQRVDLKKGEGAITVESISDENVWNSLLED
ncbi:MAG: hypothetical protein RRA35_03380 [Desulfomonilia bacterium]|nr:hypothetical protein [Desulfomonilia bacterium]